MSRNFASSTTPPTLYIYNSLAAAAVSVVNKIYHQG